jgi:site-specific DNA recombinase
VAVWGLDAKQPGVISIPVCPYAGLIRISRVAGREGERFLSPTVQRESIERQAVAHGIEVSEIVEERDISGSVPIEQRAVGRLVERIESGELDGLVVWRVSRYSRNLLDGITIASRIVKAGGRLSRHCLSP